MSPGRHRTGPIRLHVTGEHAHRQPLAYAPIRAACTGAIRLSDRPEEADVVAVAHIHNLQTEGTALRRMLGAGQRLVVLSEEPYWDTVWAADPLRRTQSVQTEAGPLPFTFLNHHTSGLFDFDRIPYFLLTHHHFAARYARWFARNARLGAADWQAQFRAAPLRAVFMAVYRRGDRFARHWPEAGLAGLAEWRTRIAEACAGPGVLCCGIGWQDRMPRQALPDWHLDKVRRLAGRARFVSAIENTHHRHYVTEKIFDAFAAGAVPLYAAAPDHRLRSILPAASWLDLQGCAPAEAPGRLAGFAFDAAFIEAYRAAQSRLAGLFADPEILAGEYDRLRRALAGELAAVLEAPADPGGQGASA